KDAILKELQAYYRDEMHLGNFAPRLGELMMMLNVYEVRSTGLDKHFEMMRLLNVFDDKTIIYRMS
ncbi:hypothetical protein PMAYCL1PPCAC_17124, partial [Pristionchus mayeri]